MEQFSFRNDILPLKDKLYRLALRITLNTGEAEDIVQDTMIKVWKNRESLSDVVSIEAYCLTVCRNLSIDRSQKKEAQTAELKEAYGQSDGAMTADEKLAHDEKLQVIRRLFDQLPEKQRTVMQLRDIEGKSYKEIAQIMNLSEEDVKVTLFRARRKIRKQYLEIENYGL